MANCRPLARRPALAPMARSGRPGLLPRWHRQTKLLRSVMGCAGSSQTLTLFGVTNDTLLLWCTGCSLLVPKEVFMPEFYPEETKVQRSKRFSNSSGKIVKAFSHTKCGRCDTIIGEGTDCVWLRGKGCFHKQGECPPKETPSE